MDQLVDYETDEPEFHPVLISGGSSPASTDLSARFKLPDEEDQVRIIPVPLGGSTIQLVISGQLRANLEQLANYMKSQKGTIELAEEELKRVREAAENPTAHRSATTAAVANLPGAEAKVNREKNALAALEKLHDEAVKSRPGIDKALKEALAERDALASELNERYGPIVDFVTDLFTRIRACEDRIISLKAVDPTVDARSVEAIATGATGKIYVKGQDPQSLVATLKLPAFGTSKAFNGVAPRQFNPATTPLELEIHNQSGNPVAVHGPFVQSIIPNNYRTRVTFTVGGLSTLSLNGVSAVAV